MAEQRARRGRGERYASHAEMCKWLTSWRNDPAIAWLAESPIHPQQQALRRLDEALRCFVAAAKAGKAGGRGRVGPPSFKRRGEEPCIRYPDPKQFSLDAANGRVKLPKLGWLRLRVSQPVVGVLRNVSISREGTAWFASIQVQVEKTVLPLDLPPTVGIDLGVAKFAALSDGSSVDPLKALARQKRRLRQYQRSVSRKVKGSSNRRKAAARLGALHRRIARQRSDWLHKLTSDIAGRHITIAIEDLRIKNLSASAKGSIEAPGTNVRQKAGLNRAILDAGWGEFARQLTYKIQWRGGQVILVNPAYTSRTCRVCGHEAADNRKAQAVFACVVCGHTENADVHAAKNILERGLALFEQQRSAAGHAVWLSCTTQRAAACGGEVSPVAIVRSQRAAPLKQEPTEAEGLV